MSYNYILHAEQPINPPTALNVSDRIWSPARRDSNRIYAAWMKAVPIAVATSIITAANIVPVMDNAKDIATASITTGFSVAAAYLARTVYETRRKLDYMRRNFERAAQGFQREDTIFTQRLKNALNTHRPSIPEMFDFKKYPMRTSLALAFAAPAALVDSGQTVLLSTGSFMFLMGTAIDEELKTASISKVAHTAKLHLEIMKFAKLSKFKP